jgi:hypothetical protein
MATAKVLLDWQRSTPIGCCQIVPNTSSKRSRTYSPACSIWTFVKQYLISMV